MVGTASSSPLKGPILGVIRHDPCEEMRLEDLRRTLAAKPAAPIFKHPAPEQVRFENCPVVETLNAIQLSSEENASSRS